MEKALEFLKKSVDALKGAANTLKNLFLKLDLTKKIIAISAVSAVVVAAIVIPLFVGGANKDSGNADSGTAKATAEAFLYACIEKDAAEACSYMPDFKLKEDTVANFQAYLETYIDAYASIGCTSLTITTRRVYDLYDDEKSDVLNELKKNSAFDENKLEDYKGILFDLNKYSDPNSAPIDEVYDLTLIKYDGEWVVVSFEWPD